MGKKQKIKATTNLKRKGHIKEEIKKYKSYDLELI